MLAPFPQKPDSTMDFKSIPLTSQSRSPSFEDKEFSLGKIEHLSELSFNIETQDTSGLPFHEVEEGPQDRANCGPSYDNLDDHSCEKTPKTKKQIAALKCFQSETKSNYESLLISEWFAGMSKKTFIERIQRTKQNLQKTKNFLLARKNNELCYLQHVKAFTIIVLKEVFLDKKPVWFKDFYSFYLKCCKEIKVQPMSKVSTGKLVRFLFPDIQKVRRSYNIGNQRPGLWYRNVKGSFRKSDEYFPPDEMQRKINDMSLSDDEGDHGLVPEVIDGATSFDKKKSSNEINNANLNGNVVAKSSATSLNLFMNPVKNSKFVNFDKREINLDLDQYFQIPDFQMKGLIVVPDNEVTDFITLYTSFTKQKITMVNNLQFRSLFDAVDDFKQDIFKVDFEKLIMPCQTSNKNLLIDWMLDCDKAAYEFLVCTFYKICTFNVPVSLIFQFFMMGTHLADSLVIEEFPKELNEFQYKHNKIIQSLIQKLSITLEMSHQVYDTVLKNTTLLNLYTTIGNPFDFRQFSYYHEFQNNGKDFNILLLLQCKILEIMNQVRLTTDVSKRYSLMTSIMEEIMPRANKSYNYYKNYNLVAKYIQEAMRMIATNHISVIFSGEFVVSDPEIIEGWVDLTVWIYRMVDFSICVFKYLNE